MPVLECKLSTGKAPKQKKQPANLSKYKLRKYFSRSSDYASLQLSCKQSNESVCPNLNSQCLGHLVYGFFEFWAYLDYEEHQISLHSKGIVRKQLHSQFRQMAHKKQLTLVIEDPLDREHNVAKNVRPEKAELLLAEFQRAQLLLLHGADWTKEVCAKTEHRDNCWNGGDVLHAVKQYADSTSCALSKEARRRLDHYIQSQYSCWLTEERVYDFNVYGLTAEKKGKGKGNKAHFRRRKNTF